MLSRKIIITLLITIISFHLSFLILFIVDPTWVQKANTSGKKKLSFLLITSYSAVFCLAAGIITLLLLPKSKTENYRRDNPIRSSVDEIQSFT